MRPPSIAASAPTANAAEDEHFAGPAAAWGHTDPNRGTHDIRSCTEGGYSHYRLPTGTARTTGSHGAPALLRRGVTSGPRRRQCGPPTAGRSGCCAGCSNGRMRVLFVLVRAVTYAALFIGFLLVYVPSRLLSWAGIVRPAVIGAPQVAGMVVGAVGALVALWCIATFVWAGRGTPAPFDPPRRLVLQGPYRFMRNPMYLGAGSALAGAALFYGSLALLAYAAVLLLITHVFVVLYEEPALRRTFGGEYDAYRARVRRWWPRLRSQPSSRGNESNVN